MEAIYRQIKAYAEKRLKIQLGDELLNKIAAICKVKKYKKGDLIITAGEAVSVSHFIVSGLVRTFYIDIDGNEVTNYFVFENRFFGGGYITTNKPIRYNFEALEDCITLEFDRTHIAEIIKAEQAFLFIYISILEDFLLEKSEREANLLTKSATERYLDLKHRFPNIENRVSQSHIASYLGITPVSLSRIRRVLRDDFLTDDEI